MPDNFKLQWDQLGDKLYETGTDRGVFYPLVNNAYGNGVAWNGLTAVTDSPSGAESNPLYADNIKYVDLRSAEEYGYTIEAYMYPDEFANCDGTAELGTGIRVGQQNRTPFGFTWRTKIGNDTDGQDHGYKIHLAYNGIASPSEKAYQTVNDSPEAITFSWEVTCTPVSVTGHKPSANIVIDTTKAPAAFITALEAMLYGSGTTEAKLPTPNEVIELAQQHGAVSGATGATGA